MRQLTVGFGKHIDISSLTKKQVKPKNRSVANHLLLCTHSGSYDDFSILTRKKKKFLLELKESLFITRDKPSLNRDHCSYLSGSTVAIQQGLVIRSFLEFYLF